MVKKTKPAHQPLVLPPRAGAWPADKVERRSVQSLLAYPQNPRIHSDEQVDALVRSLNEFGWTMPILVDEAGVCIAGHGRLQAANRMGISEVPVMVATGWTEEQKRAYRIADNALTEASVWSPQLLKIELGQLALSGYDLKLTGFDDFKLVQYMAHTGGNDPEATPDPPAVPVTVRGDVWLLGKHRLMCGDATSEDDVSILMKGQRADCVFTSPPFAVGLEYDGYEDTIENLREMIPKIAKGWSNILVPGGFAVINFNDVIAGSVIAGSLEPCEYPMALEYWPAFREAGWTLWSRRIDCKPSGRTNSNHCISSNRARPDWEHIWTWKRPGRPIIDGQVGGEFSSQAGYRDTSGRPPEVDSLVHGAGMSVNVAEWLVAIHSRVNSVVHEPFCGTGSTIIACEILSRHCYAIELSARYTDVAVIRWQEYAEQEAVLQSTGQTFEEVARDRLKKQFRARRKIVQAAE